MITYHHLILPRVKAQHQHTHRRVDTHIQTQTHHMPSCRHCRCAGLKPVICGELFCFVL